MSTSTTVLTGFIDQLFVLFFVLMRGLVKATSPCPPHTSKGSGHDNYR